MNYRFYLIGLVGIVLIFSEKTLSFSFVPKPNDPPALTAKQSAATRYYSPYRVITISSWVATGLGVFLTPKTVDEKKELELREVRSGLQYAYIIGGGFWLGEGLLLVAGESLHKGNEESIRDADLTAEDVSPHSLRFMRRAFYGLHTINVMWNVAMAMQIESKDKWYFVSGAAVAPFLTDFVNRSLFNRHKLSPYAPIRLTTGYDHETLIATINYSF